MAASLIGGGRCFPAMCGCPRDSIFEANEEFCEAWSMPERCHTSELFCASDCRGSYCEGLANQHLFHNCSDAAFNHDFYSCTSRSSLLCDYYHVLRHHPSIIISLLMTP
jgi:hypothetical protein